MFVNAVAVASPIVVVVRRISFAKQSRYSRKRNSYLADTTPHASKGSCRLFPVRSVW